MLGVIQQGSFEFLHLDEPLSTVSWVVEFLAWIYKNKERKKKSVIIMVILNRVTGDLVRIYKNKEKKGISDGKCQQKQSYFSEYLS